MASEGAVVVGAGPNGLAAAIVLARAGIPTTLIESAHEIGGGLRTNELTLPGFKHDVCSGVHPLGAASPFFSTLPLGDYGLEWIESPIAVAHPFDDGMCGVIERDISITIDKLGLDGAAYSSLVAPVAKHWNSLALDALAPLHIPVHPFRLARFGLDGIRSIQAVADSRMRTREGRALLAGIAAHAMQPLTGLTTAAIALMLAGAAHVVGWPIVRGGSANLANALAAYFMALGGTIQTGWHVHSLAELPAAKAVLLDLTPRQLLGLHDARWSWRYRNALSRYEYGPGVFKADWALSEPVPWKSAECMRAATLHLGGTIEEIADSELGVHKGQHSERPFILLAQPSVFDSSRAPEGRHTLWAYCHVPSGSTVDMLPRIEAQIERFAPGFRDTIIARSTMNTVQMEAHDANIIGGDISQGANTFRQMFFRPAIQMNPYATSLKGVYMCSSSTPPGAAVHGMCGYHAANSALKREFGIRV